MEKIIVCDSVGGLGFQDLACKVFAQGYVAETEINEMM